MKTTTLSSKGQVVLPRLVRSKLRLVPGTRFVCEVKGESVVLTPESSSRIAKVYVTDAMTGLRVTKRQAGVEPVSSEMVKALLEDFP